MASHAHPERVIASVRRLGRFPGLRDAAMDHESLTGRFRQRTAKDSAIPGVVKQHEPYVVASVCGVPPARVSADYTRQRIWFLLRQSSNHLT
jgi:hypothetical protein